MKFVCRSEISCLCVCFCLLLLSLRFHSSHFCLFVCFVFVSIKASSLCVDECFVCLFCVCFSCLSEMFSPGPEGECMKIYVWVQQYVLNVYRFISTSVGLLIFVDVHISLRLATLLGKVVCFCSLTTRLVKFTSFMYLMFAPFRKYIICIKKHSNTRKVLHVELFGCLHLFVQCVCCEMHLIFCFYFLSVSQTGCKYQYSQHTQQLGFFVLFCVVCICV